MISRALPGKLPSGRDVPHDDNDEVSHKQMLLLDILRSNLRCGLVVMKPVFTRTRFSSRERFSSTFIFG